MNPNIEISISLSEIVFYELGRCLRPRPNWHNLDRNTCLIWQGSMSSEGMRKRRQFNLTGSSTIIYTQKGLPLMRLGSHRSISVHRLLYLLYRQPLRPITVMSKINCSDPRCVNPWHWQAHEQNESRTPHPWPETSMLAGMSDYLKGRRLEDIQSLKLREAERDQLKAEIIRELEREYKLMTKGELDAMKVETPTAEPEIGNPWLDVHIPGELSDDGETLLIEPTIERYSKPTKFYDSKAEYIRVFKVLDKKLSPELESAFEIFNCQLPMVNEARVEDYRIGRSTMDDALYFWKDCMAAKVKCGSQILERAKRERFHIRLLLMDMQFGENKRDYRPLDLQTIDWTK